MSDVLAPKQAFKRALAQIEKRGGVPAGKTVVGIYHANRHGVWLKFYKTPESYQRAMNKEKLTVSDVDVADMKRRLASPHSRGFVLNYVVFAF
jgi:hypothetical protein